MTNDIIKRKPMKKFDDEIKEIARNIKDNEHTLLRAVYLSSSRNKPTAYAAKMSNYIDSSSTVTRRILYRLKRKGLVRKVSNPSKEYDRTPKGNKTFYKITEKGEKVLEQVKEDKEPTQIG